MNLPDQPAGLHRAYPEPLPPPSGEAERAAYLKLVKGPRRTTVVNARTISERVKAAYDRDPDYRERQR